MKRLLVLAVVICGSVLLAVAEHPKEAAGVAVGLRGDPPPFCPPFCPRVNRVSR